LQRLQRDGFPNYYGPRRFGRGGSTVEIGLACLQGQRPRGLSPIRFRLALSAVQSMLFNDWLIRRVRRGEFLQVIRGEVLQKRPAGGLFLAEDLANEQRRYAQDEVVPTGPMFGSRMRRPQSPAAEFEAEVLFAHALKPEVFDRFGKLLTGTRRAIRVIPEGLTWDCHGTEAVIQFCLPAGCYATVLLQELMKTIPEASIPAAELPGDSEPLMTDGPDIEPEV